MLSRNFMIYNTDLSIENLITDNNESRKRPSKSFESISHKHIEDDIYLLSFKWIDKIKISDKYSKSYFNEIQSILFEDLGKLAVFCNSESNMHYFREKMGKKYNIKLDVLPYYDIWKDKFLADELNEQIIAYEIKNPNLSESEENFKKFSGEKVQLDHLKSILMKDEESVVNITLGNSDINQIYYIDPSSLISLSDNVLEPTIYSLLNSICGRY